MKAAVYTGGDRIEVKDVEIPRRGPQEALVRVKYSGICGSDLFHSSGKNPRVHPPVILGLSLWGRC